MGVDADTEGLPVLRSSDYSVPAEHTFDVFHDANAPVFDSNAPGGGTDFRMDTVDYLVDDVLVCRLETDPHTIRRTADHIRAGGTSWITVQLHHVGGIRGAVGGARALDLGPDKVAIVDLSEPLTGWSRGGVSTWVCLPRHRIADPDRLEAVRQFDRSSLRGRLLESAVGDLWRRVGRARASEADELAGAFAETANAVLEADRFMPADRDLAVAMRDFLNVNLSDLNLGVEGLQAAFRCSRATAYRVFEPHGGVAAYIREQRLMRCFVELTRPTESPVLVSEVATRWGFENPSHFNRLMKSKFGLPPSRLTPPPPGEQRPTVLPGALATRSTRFHAWARRA